MFQHPYWKENDTPLGKELCYLPRGGKGFILSLLFSAAVLLFSLYGAFIFVKGWWMDREEVLAGGVVLFMIACGGVFLGTWFFGHLFRRITYLLGPGELKVTTKKFVKSEEQFIDKAQIKEIVQLYTPPGNSEPTGSPGSWRTCLAYRNRVGEYKEFFLEGMSKEESDGLTAVISEWSGVKRRLENTTE